MASQTARSAVAGAAILAGNALGVLPACAAPIQFEDHADYSAGFYPFRVAAADLNGDGHIDLITANPAPFQPPFVVTVLINLGDGTFAAPAFYPTGAPGRSVAADDLDGDADMDLAVGLQEGEFRVAVLANDAQGHFAAPTFLAPGAGRPDGIAIVDLDLDEDRDIVLGQHAGDEIVVLKNQGGGTFAPPVGYGGPSDAYFAHLAAGDVDGDGDPDLAFSRSLSITPPSIYRNLGDGTFGPREPLPVPTAEFAGVAFGDLDGDLDLDLVLVSETGSRLFVLRNLGLGTFGVWGQVAAGVETQLGNQVTLADLDGDGLTDAIVPAGNTFRLSTLQSGGPSGLEPATFHDLGGQPTHVDAADLDGDGDLDLASSLPHRDELSVLRNVSGGTTAVGAAAPAIAVAFGPAYSNPTPRGATIPYHLGRPAAVRIAVLDVAGRRVRDLFQGELPAGDRTVTWDGRNDSGAPVASGVYLIELRDDTGRCTARVVVSR